MIVDMRFRLWKTVWRHRMSEMFPCIVFLCVPRTRRWRRRTVRASNGSESVRIHFSSNSFKIIRKWTFEMYCTNPYLFGIWQNLDMKFSGMLARLPIELMFGMKNELCMYDESLRLALYTLRGCDSLGHAIAAYHSFQRVFPKWRTVRGVRARSARFLMTQLSRECHLYHSFRSWKSLEKHRLNAHQILSIPTRASRSNTGTRLFEPLIHYLERKAGHYTEDMWTERCTWKCWRRMSIETLRENHSNTYHTTHTHTLE